MIASKPAIPEKRDLCSIADAFAAATDAMRRSRHDRQPSSLVFSTDTLPSFGLGRNKTISGRSIDFRDDADRISTGGRWR